MVTNKKTQLTPRAIAENLPAPKPGMNFTVQGLDVLCEYMKMHGLKVLGFRNGTVVVEPVAKPSQLEEEKGH